MTLPNILRGYLDTRGSRQTGAQQAELQTIPTVLALLRQQTQDQRQATMDAEQAALSPLRKRIMEAQAKAAEAGPLPRAQERIVGADGTVAFYDPMNPELPPGFKAPVPQDPTQVHATNRTFDIKNPLPTQDKPPKEPSEGERKGRFFYDRAQPAAKIIDTFNDQKALDALSAKAGMIGNWTKTAEGRRLIQAGKTWAMAVLRQDSGGAITDDEMEFYFDTYLPRPGDDAATLAQKAESRRVVTDGLLTVAGRAAPSAPAAPPTASPAAPAAPAAKSNPFGDLIPRKP